MPVLKHKEVYRCLGLPLCIIPMLPRRCNMIEAFICAVRVARGQLVMTLLAKKISRFRL